VLETAESFWKLSGKCAKVHFLWWNN